MEYTRRDVLKLSGLALAAVGERLSRHHAWMRSGGPNEHRRDFNRPRVVPVGSATDGGAVIEVAPDLRQARTNKAGLPLEASLHVMMR
jgi:hypothetical protein